MFKSHFFIRNLEAEDLLENFLVASVSAVLLIRFFLYIFHFPQIGGGSLHIAHMIWGGLLMLIALFLFIIFLNRSLTRVAVVIGGLGFGVFIDELGKFITSDNNYFFKPTFSIMYLIFVLIYIIMKKLPEYREVSQKEYLVNAIEMLKEAVINDLDADEKQRAMMYLKKADPQNPIATELTTLLTHLETIPSAKQSLFTKLRARLKTLLLHLIASRHFHTILILCIVIQTLVTLFLAFILIGELNQYMYFGLSIIAASIVFLATRKTKKRVRITILIVTGIFFVFGYFLSYRFISTPSLSFNTWGIFVSLVITTVLSLRGFYYINRSKLKMLQLLHQSVLVSILLTQVFLFYRYQLFALIGLFFNVVILLTIEYMLALEREGSAIKK